MHRVLHECVVGCPILSSIYEHAPIYHLIVLDSTPSYTLCALTSHHRVRCSSSLKQLAKLHSHVTYTPCKAPQKAVEGATALFMYLQYSTTVQICYRCAVNKNTRRIALAPGLVYYNWNFVAECARVYYASKQAPRGEIAGRRGAPSPIPHLIGESKILSSAIRRPTSTSALSANHIP